MDADWLTRPTGAPPEHALEAQPDPLPFGLPQHERTSAEEPFNTRDPTDVKAGAVIPRIPCSYALAQQPCSLLLTSAGCPFEHDEDLTSRALSLIHI